MNDILGGAWNSIWGLGKVNPVTSLPLPRFQLCQARFCKKRGTSWWTSVLFNFWKFCSLLWKMQNNGYCRWNKMSWKNCWEDLNWTCEWQMGKMKCIGRYFFSLQVWLFSFFLFGKECNLMLPKGFEKRLVVSNISISRRFTETNSFWMGKKRDLLLKSQPTV